MNSLNLYLMLSRMRRQQRPLTPVQNAGRIVRSSQQEVGGRDERNSPAWQARPVSSTCVFGRLTGPLKRTILTQTGCTFIFMKDIQLTIYIIVSGLQRSTKPVIASPQVSVPLISWLVDSSRKGGTTPIQAESGCDCQTIDSMVNTTQHAVEKAS